MKLFGPDSQTSLIDEDDDGGAGLTRESLQSCCRATTSCRYDITTDPEEPAPTASG